MSTAVLIFLSGVVMASTGQVFMKMGALHGRHQSLLRSVFHPHVVVGYLLMLASTVTSTIALKSIPLHLTVSLLPLGYIVVVLLSVVILDERMKRQQVWGMLVILAGVVVFNLGAE